MHFFPVDVWLKMLSHYIGFWASAGPVEPAQELTFFSLEVFFGQKALQNPVGPNTVILAQSRKQGQLSNSILLQLTVSKLYTGKDKINMLCDYLQFKSLWSRFW